jgi:hypothetical protein
MKKSVAHKVAKQNENKTMQTTFPFKKNCSIVQLSLEELAEKSLLGPGNKGTRYVVGKIVMMTMMTNAECCLSYLFYGYEGTERRRGRVVNPV